MSTAESVASVDSRQADLQAALFSIDVVVNHILALMPMKQLQTCSRVCKLWREIAWRVKRTRRAVGWLFYSPQLHTHDIQHQIPDKLSLLSSEPHHAVVFISSSLHEDHVAVPGNNDGTRPRRSKMSKMPFVSYLRTVLPPCCETVTLCSDGVVGSDWDHHCHEVETALSASCLLLPRTDGATVRHFTASTDQLKAYFDQTPPLRDISELHSHTSFLETLTGIPAADEPRLVLLFYVEHISEAETDLATRMLLQYRDVVVAGGYVDQAEPDATSTNHDPQDDVAVVGIAFCGGSNIQVASVVVGSDINTSKEVEVVLQKLKNSHVTLGPRTVGFMFACIGRGQYHYHQQSNVESNAFHKLFPSTPLFGFFANGEIGFEYLPDYSRPLDEQNIAVVSRIVSEEIRASWQLPEVHHSYTTIFVLLGLP